MNEETREKIFKLIDYTRRLIHVAFIPLVLYIGITRTTPRPSLFRIISPLAA
ncbi:hypothetical protein HDU92_000617 [Lobulomyces angularis]|nr:hypothetical protein HDU92_000617 [Lobulomyces angularis]